MAPGLRGPGTDGQVSVRRRGRAITAQIISVGTLVLSSQTSAWVKPKQLLPVWTPAYAALRACFAELPELRSAAIDLIAQTSSSQMPPLSTSPIGSTASYPLGRNIRSGSSFMILRPARSPSARAGSAPSDRLVGHDSMISACSHDYPR